MAREGYIRLVHWKQEEVGERIDRLANLGYEVDGSVPGTSIGVRELAEAPPLAFVIDLGRLPSHGREVARALRQSKALRAVPIVFVDGKADKRAGVEEEFPDASFAAWDGIGATLEAAIANPPVDPIVPRSPLGPHSGTPLPRKLGIKPGAVVALIDAPDGFEATLGELPEGADLKRRHRGRRDMTIWFTTRARDLGARLPAITAAVGEGVLWIAWPKRTSEIDSDLAQGAVIEAGLGAGLVDSKNCAIDDDWSGLRFTRRRGR
jgi:CheY-like chemotaxis protein